MSADGSAMTETLVLDVPEELYRRLRATAAQQGTEIEDAALASLMRGITTTGAPPGANPILDLPAVDTGVPDLSEQHDHYLYGTPKRV